MGLDISMPKPITVGHLVKQLKKYCRPTDIDFVRLAYDFAAEAHKGQFRKSGEPYINHPLSAAYLLSKIKIDTNIIVAALLHDVPEDTNVSIQEIEENFGSDIAIMVTGITKLGKLKYRGMERYIENLRKMFVAMAEDMRVIIIKFVDRIHNLMTLDAHSPAKRHLIALESLEIYAPIANRLGMGEIKGTLEDLAFPYVFPKEYKKVKYLRDNQLAEESIYLDQVIKTTRKKLLDDGIKVLDIHGREKQLYSLYQKLLLKNWEIDKIHDIVAVRIIVPDLTNCYAALGTIHRLWKPLKGRIKDYVAQPKPNGYKSLHTTVFCNEGRVVEFQIRTEEMHKEAEYGIAAHWHYDEKGKLKKVPTKDIAWAQELAKIQKEKLHNISDLESLKIDFFQNRIFVFTPNGDVIDLPENATPIDFAYYIHSEIGHKCNGARINDQMVSLDTALKSGDVVEILTDKNRKGPSPDWLKIVKTTAAKDKIKSYLNGAKRSWIKNLLPLK